MIDLDAAEAQARESHRWATAEAEFVPLSTRDHYGHTFPALVAELRAAREVVEEAKNHVPFLPLALARKLDAYDQVATR